MIRSRGFTIVELLIVIVVIAILAAITIVAYTGIQERARVSGFTDAVRKVEKAFQLKATADERSSYWREQDLLGTGNPNVSDVIAGTDLRNYLQAVPEVSGMSGLRWVYDNDGDSYDGCSASAVGVNLIIYNVNQYLSVMQELDNTLDDGNLACGKIRHSASDDGGNGAIFYQLGGAGGSI